MNRSDVDEDESRDSVTFRIIGVAMMVHRELGHGFLEAVYRQALARELRHQGVAFQKEVEIPIHYRGFPLETNYRADFICEGTIVLEVKALQKLTSIEDAQVMNYLKATGLNLALLLNFGGPSLQHRRIIFHHHRPANLDFSASEISTEYPCKKN